MPFFITKGSLEDAVDGVEIGVGAGDRNIKAISLFNSTSSSSFLESNNILENSLTNPSSTVTNFCQLECSFFSTLMVYLPGRSPSKR